MLSFGIAIWALLDKFQYQDNQVVFLQAVYLLNILLAMRPILNRTCEVFLVIKLWNTESRYQRGHTCYGWRRSLMQILGFRLRRKKCIDFLEAVDLKLFDCPPLIALLSQQLWSTLTLQVQECQGEWSHCLKTLAISKRKFTIRRHITESSTRLTAALPCRCLPDRCQSPPSH